MTTKQPSKYKPIWEKLKAEKICRITAPQKFHKTIIKMVRRTRDRDTAYLFHLAESHKEHSITIAIDPVTPTVITFTLTERISLYGL